MARNSIESINEAFKNDVFAALPAAVATVNADRDDGINIDVPTDLIGDYEDRHSVSTPYCFFSCEEMTSEASLSGTTVSVAYMMAVVIPDYENSEDNKKAWYRYSEAVHRAIASSEKKRYTSNMRVEYIPMGTLSSEAAKERVAGCFVRYDIAVSYGG